MVASLVYYGRKVKGLDFTGLGPMNEQDWNCLEGPCSAPAQYTTILHDLAAELSLMGLADVRLLSPDTAQVNAGATYISQMLKDSTVAGLIDHLALHDYSGAAVATQPPYPGKNYWLSETSAFCTQCDAGTAGPPNEWSFATQTFDIVLGDIKNGFNAVMIWEAYDSFWYHHNATSLWGLLAYDTATGLYTPRKRAYAYTQFHHFIGSGDIVIGASDSIASVPTMVAVYNPTTGKVAIIGRNSGSSPITISGQLANLPVASTLALYQTSSTVNFARGGDVSVTGGFFTVQIAADSIFTLTSQPIAP
jgi:O-glycosyl hydrolase